jgi:hypothetical protein
MHTFLIFNAGDAYTTEVSMTTSHFIKEMLQTHHYKHHALSHAHTNHYLTYITKLIRLLTNTNGIVMPTIILIPLHAQGGAPRLVSRSNWQFYSSISTG